MTHFTTLRPCPPSDVSALQAKTALLFAGLISAKLQARLIGMYPWDPSLQMGNGIFTFIFCNQRSPLHAPRPSKKKGWVNSTAHSSRAENVTPTSLGSPAPSCPHPEGNLFGTRLTLSLCSVWFCLVWDHRKQDFKCSRWVISAVPRTSVPYALDAGNSWLSVRRLQPHRIRHLHGHHKFHVAKY